MAQKRKPPPSAADVDAAIAETAKKARELQVGQPHGYKTYVASRLRHTFLRPASATDHAKEEGTYAFKWRGKMEIYDPRAAEIVFRNALDSDATSDQLLCYAAAVMLDATRGIADDTLRGYVVARLTGALRPIPRKRRGPSTEKNKWRDFCIQGWLIPSLMRQGFHATRNEATSDEDAESACSIVSKALNNIGIELSEKGVETVWGARPSSMKAPSNSSK